MATTRRLAAILAADVAGYSRLMEADEQGTLTRLKTFRAEVLDPAIAAHNGRIFKTTGDGFLAEFASSVDALNCAQETQAGLGKLNAELTPDNRIELRIGIHQGDVVVEDGDIFGDGVNVAARLEALADPGGICVSARVQEDAVGKLDLAFRDMGEQQLKNIARPVHVYALRPGAVADLPAPSVLPVAPISQPAVAPRLSIVVLPFANLSDDREQQYFADGITEDLTTDLSRISGSFVISRNTAFTYRDKPISAKQIGRDLGVRYVLEGSVRRSGGHVRVTAQLIDAETDAHLWAERFDHDAGNLFALQDEITSRIAVTLGAELVRAEVARSTENPDALDCILRGRAAYLRRHYTRETRVEQVSWYERALVADPKSVEAQSRLASALISRFLDNMTDTPTADIARAERLAEKALAASPHNHFARHARAQVLRGQRRYAEAIPEYEAVIAADRNWAGSLFALGQCKLYVGAIEATIPLTDQAIRLSPREAEIGLWYLQIGRVHLLQARTQEAVGWFEKARNATPAHADIRAWLASAYALSDERERAVFELGEARRLSEDDRYMSVARVQAVMANFLAPRIRALYEATYFAGLRKAGVPEE